ncbi:DsrE family protein [Daejeonella oryzae]|uniref:DsrE family protein n=1 Tax=Daejeonella oryzae TaxID=1122943 RepID=UPI0003FE0AEC|nr:DsrE family protein [Daejeonella oryzae]
MKKLIVLISILLLGISGGFSQTVDYKVVFDLTSKDSSAHQMIIRWLKGISKSDPKAQMEVVFYGKSLDMITKQRSTVAADVAELSKNPNIKFKVCAVAMKNQNVEETQLLSGVQIVPDGIYEIISKQKEGWGYIKATQ